MVTTFNNEMSTFVTVRKGGLNVLYVEGEIRIEQKFIRRSLDPSPDIKVDYVRLDARRKETRPPDLKDRFQPGRYDASSIFGDVDAQAFDLAELDQLAKTINAGAGFMMLGGMHSFGAGGYGRSALADVLPIHIDRFEKQNFDEPIRSDFPDFDRQPADDADADRSDAKPDAVEHARKKPRHLVGSPALGRRESFPRSQAGCANAGREHRRSATVGCQRLRRRPRAGVCWRFDLAMVAKRLCRRASPLLAANDSLAGAQRPEHRRQRLGCDRPSPLWPRRTGRVRCRKTRNASGVRQLPKRLVKGEVKLPKWLDRRAQAAARRAPETAGIFLDAQASGDYTIRVQATHNGQLLGSVQSRFLVYEQDRELENPAADRGALENLAMMTGGRAGQRLEQPSWN